MNRKTYTLLSALIFSSTPILAASDLENANTADVQYLRARLYEEGIGPKQDIPKATKLYKKAAKKGVSLAQNKLATFYLMGSNGIQQDSVMALYYFELAANQGCAPAILNLGYIYEKGLGVAQNISSAIENYRLAADYGDPRGTLNLKRLASQPPIQEQGLPGADARGKRRKLA